ncbi:ABC transporter substrate-binding protein [Lysinibacillus piscis]|uniref:Sugar ABC transporter substrate-binding protein n=1 Tax=Lysinibacillus piscis TaxID=2518931 RepID=A0ABQ5NMQ5_9BACI|nr:ABC transporter substrate-binding protein [Lysinibacillus sp. KH24]GLC89656.1 sugar ABC transporter substrate-binding protein [Lysinibacillus sp. KH24]
MKKWWLIGGIFIILLVLAGFWYWLAHPDKTEVKESKKLTEIRFWRNYGNDLENAAFADLVQAFEKEHPTIKVKMRSIPYSDYEILVRTEFAVGNPPDVLMIDSPNLALYADTGALQPLDDFIEENLEDDFAASTIASMKYKQQHYLMPMIESGIALFYNIKLFEAADLPLPSPNVNKPLTWSEVKEMAHKIHALDNNVSGIDPAQGFPSGEAAAYFKMPLLWQFGAEILSPDGSQAEGYLNTEEAIAALDFYQSLYTEGLAKRETTGGGDPFAENLLGLTVLGSWAVADYQNHHNLQLGVDFGVAALPKEQKQAVPNGSWSMAMATKSRHQEEAWAFIEFMTNYENVKYYVEQTHDIPARFSVVDNVPELSQYPMNIFVEQGRYYAKNRPITPVYPVVSDVIRTLFEEVGIGDVNTREAVERATKTIDRALQQRQIEEKER